MKGARLEFSSRMGRLSGFVVLQTGTYRVSMFASASGGAAAPKKGKAAASSGVAAGSYEICIDSGRGDILLEPVLAGAGACILDREPTDGDAAIVLSSGDYQRLAALLEGVPGGSDDEVGELEVLD